MRIQSLIRHLLFKRHRRGTSGPSRPSLNKEEKNSTHPKQDNHPQTDHKSFDHVFTSAHVFTPGQAMRPYETDERCNASLKRFVEIGGGIRIYPRWADVK